MLLALGSSIRCGVLRCICCAQACGRKLELDRVDCGITLLLRVGQRKVLLMGSEQTCGYGSQIGDEGDIETELQQVSNKGIVKVLIRAQITGRGCKSLRKLPAAIYGRLQNTTRDIAPLCIELESAMVAFDVDSCQEALSKVAQSLCEWNNNYCQLNREAFVLFGGDILLLRALFCKFPTPDNAEKLRFTVKVLYIRNECLSILRELCTTVHPFIEHLAADKKFVVKLFGMMRFHNTFNNGECALPLPCLLTSCP